MPGDVSIEELRKAFAEKAQQMEPLEKALVEREREKQVKYPIATRPADCCRISGIGDAPNRASTLPTDPKARKQYPIATGFFDYFPDAIAEIAHVSWVGNEQHNPGEPLHWARGKSTDQDDTCLRHFAERGKRDADGQRHTAKAAWRLLAILQLEIEAEQAQGHAEAPQAAGWPTPAIMCSAVRNGFFCTRPAGHLGDHEAYGSEPLVTWPQASAALNTAKGGMKL